MAWSDAARRAALLARRMRAKSAPYIRRTFPSKSRGDMMPSNIRPADRRNPRTLRKGETARAKLRHRQRLDQAYESSIKAGYNAGKKRGGFF